MTPSDTPPIVSIVSGGIAGGVEGFLTYPFEFAKTRAQLGQLPTLNTITSKTSPKIAASSTLSKSTPITQVSRNPYLLIAQIYKNEGGIRALYKGCTVMVIGSVGKDAVRFLSFDSVQNYFRTSPDSVLTPSQNMLAGMAAGVIASVCAVTPTERIKTALIDDARVGSAQQYTGTMNAIKVILNEDGVRGLYRGLVGTTLKQASATGFRMGSYNIVKDFEVGRGVQQGPAVNFANGAFAGVVTTLGTMPFDTIKTRSQSAKVTTTLQAITGVYHESGIRGYWKGTVMRLSRTVFSGGILFTTAEAVAKILNPLVGR
ncbi:probable CTP1-Mitochondrial citrate transporter-member of the mitochondrial carrier (MCF) family [Rhynchosporium secalis]|uniref:Probable CTP1-Mitochondrial citrate transporter-member of the mitochondrial carrier (MCF) family n=1 Tax=Rhynchosporium secalis TaxID=38038 RepID=A0A1E1MI20_RHYSE|nr:probable CTP1-Mitochondrial citrate transporter-member of the mitochondrial carrier (MCF) family [Rhynchosporium secalis]